MDSEIAANALLRLLYTVSIAGSENLNLELPTIQIQIHTMNIYIRKYHICMYMCTYVHKSSLNNNHYQFYYTSFAQPVAVHMTKMASE